MKNKLNIQLTIEEVKRLKDILLYFRESIQERIEIYKIDVGNIPGDYYILELSKDCELIIKLIKILRRKENFYKVISEEVRK